jgi:Domain of unknown function (DUF4105)
MLYRIVLALCLLLMSVQALARDDQYLQALIQQAREMRLAEHPEWLNLLHYKPYIFLPGSRSLADDPSFFNAPNGRTDALAELENTLSAFFSQTEESDKQQNPQCRFVARYHWLKQRLKFDSSRLQPQVCKRFNAWMQAINPHEMTLVFPSSFLNSPASMYGHTLLRIDAKDQNESTRLLAYTIGYSASTDESNGLMFAYLGLTGGYPGVFLTAPYYLKVSEYSDMENRDIWEYRLNLTPEEIERAMMHIWELGPTYFDYYFIDENCAYHLLSVLEVARPGLKLTDEFRWWAIPSDTVRAVTENTDMLKQTIYRPANTTVIMQRLRSMQPPMRTLARDLSKGVIKPGDQSMQELTPPQQAQVLELSQDYLTYLRASKGDWAEAGALSRTLLLARSQLNEPAATPVVEVPATRPDQGHKSLRVSLAVGNREGVAYQELAVRPAYHDQNDPGAGYIRGAQIQFFNFTLRHYGDETGTRVEELIPIDIFSLSPRNDFFQSLSWKVNVGWARKRLPDGSEPLLGRLNAGAGFAWDTPSLDQPVAQTYIFMDATLESTSQYDSHYALGMGPAAGIIADISSNWRVNAYARVQRFGLGEPHTTAEITLLQRYTIGRQTALRLELTRKMEFDMSWNDVRLSLQQYF